MKASPRFCPSCHSEHLGQVPCGLTWIQRLRSVQLHPDATPSRTRVNYYDAGAVADVFGEDSEERLYDATKGRGPAYRHPRTGELFRKDRRTKEPVAVSPAELDSFYLGGDTEG